METAIEKSSSKRFSIPARNEQFDDEFHVSVRLSNRKTKCYTCKNAKGWKGRIRSFVQHVKDETDCHIDTVTISHIAGGERLSRKQFLGHNLKTVS